ncbi:MAG: hypothetical protein J5794_07105 [Lachnospiraceae bacterium]|nr:hypothetical protein [Lachnospiraceae bacterium]
MGDNIWYLILGIAVLSVLVYSLLTAGRRRKQKILSRIKAGFGSLPDREYTEEELKKIRTYFDAVHQEGTFAVDDVTWHDLHLDEIFMTLNETFSSCGEEELYRILREPCFDAGELKERDRVISYFSEHPDVRAALQYEFACIGRTKKVALIQYINEFQSLELRPSILHLLPILMLLFSVGLCFVHIMAGILALLLTIILNIISYYRIKSMLEPWYVSLSAVAYLVNGALRVSKGEIPELESYLETLRREAGPLSSIRRNTKWLGSNSQGVISMDLFEILMDYLRMLTHFDFIVFNHMVRQVLKNEEHVLNLMHTLGYLEAMIAAASFRKMIPFYTAGSFDHEKPHLSLKNGFHVLVREPVANSISVDRPVLLTGSNASGKSTFLRMTALAVLLGETIATAPATSLSSSFFRIYSSMALSDDLLSGESYFIVEIKSLKRIMDALDGDIPVLSFVDEVLRGTNTVERISASSQILKKFAETGSMIFAATHDIELTTLLEPYFENYHFEEQVEGDTVRFDYILRPGKATSRNAIRLLGMMGYEEDVIGKAEESAERFTKEGIWILS